MTGANHQSVWHQVVAIPANLLVLLIGVYRLVLSPWLGRSCRFEPTCSAYAEEAIIRYGAVRGTWLTLRRLGRCHPGCKGGYDPVPDNSHSV